MAPISIKGLAKETTNKSLQEYFAHYGTVTKAEVKRDPGTGQSLRIGRVEFSKEKSAKKALADAEIHLLDDRAIEVAEVPKATDADEEGEEEEEEEAVECEEYDLPAASTKPMKKTNKKQADKADETEPPKKKSKKSEPEEGRKLFVGGLEKTVNQKELRAYFSHYGDLEKVDLKVGKGNSFAFVVFAKAKAAEKAVAAPEHTIAKEVSFALANGQSRKIFVGGLGETVSQEEVNEYFSYYGEVVDSRVSARFCCVTFRDPISVELVQMEPEHVIGGKTATTRIYEKRGDKLFIGGLPHTTTQTSLTKYLSYYGKVKSVQLKEGKGFAFVYFASQASTSACVEESSHVIDGKQFSVRKCDSSKKLASKVFIGGLSQMTGPESLYGYLSYYGELDEVDLKVDNVTGASKGFAFAIFEDPASAALCIAEKEPHVVDGKQVEIKKAEKNGKKENTQVFVGGLPKTTTTDSLWAYLAYYGELEELDLKVDSETGNLRGFAFATFVNAADAQRCAAEKEQHVVDGKAVHIDMKAPKGKGKGKGRGKGKGKAQKGWEEAWPSEGEWDEEWAEGDEAWGEESALS